MAITKTFSITGSVRSGEYVSDQMFGGNALHDINIETDGAVRDSFSQSVEAMGITNLRYPGGFAEELGDILEGGSATHLSAQLVTFLDWVKAENASGHDYTVTLGIPTKSFINYDLVRNFARMIGEEYKDIVSGIELGNEYSIGNDTITEKSYGARADLATRALDDGFRDAGLSGNNQPDILIQMAEIFGRGSSYNGTGQHLEANRDIIDQLSTQTINAVDGVVNHYYYSKDHMDDDRFSVDASGIAFETRHLFNKTEAWEQAWSEATNRADLDLSITEWNIQKMNADQLGLKAAGTLLKQFEYMIEMGATLAHAWPIQHKTGNALAGNPGEDADLSPAGGLFSLMSNSLTSNGRMELVDLRLNAFITGIETSAYQNSYKSVIYIASRDDTVLNSNINLRGFNKAITGVEATIIGFDPSSSDGLSEMADDAGQNRVAKRVIQFEEYQELRRLAFFDENNSAHITISVNSNGSKTYKTYLPEPDDIIAMVDNPKTISDYYFATETDVSFSTEHLTQADLGGKDVVSFSLDPYEVIEITLYHSTVPVSAPVPTKPIIQEATINVATSTASLDALKIDMFAIETPIHYDDVCDLDIILPNAPSNEAQSILGSEMNDILNTGTGNDYIRGNNGDDYLIAGDGNDSITGSGGNDTLLGGNGDDVIYGNQNNDVLNGGAGNDTLDGGFGEDTFVFDMTGKRETDVIQDFNIEQDHIEFHGVQQSNRLGQFSNIDIVDAGSDTEIHYQDYTLRLLNVDADQFSIADIHLF